MSQSKPASSGSTHTLPYNRLSPRQFEELCLWLVRREGYERAEHLGGLPDPRARADAVRGCLAAHVKAQGRTLAQLYEDQGRLAEALPLLEQAVDIAERVRMPVAENRRRVLERVRAKLQT